MMTSISHWLAAENVEHNPGQGAGEIGLSDNPSYILRVVLLKNFILYKCLPKGRFFKLTKNKIGRVKK